MGPYRSAPKRAEEDREPRSEEIVIAVAMLVLGLAGIALGLLAGRATEAGLGVAMAIFGAFAARAVRRSR